VSSDPPTPAAAAIGAPAAGTGAPAAGTGARGHDGRFEAAADAICAGDLATLRSLLDRDPRLIGRRSAAAHRATLLHFVAANGVETARQATVPPNGAQLARLLLERGAEPDATCEAYGGGPAQTTLCLLVSSAGPLRARTDAALVQTLCRGGAAANGIDDDGLPLWTAITRGRARAAEALVACGARVDNLVFAAALDDLPALDAQLRAGSDPDTHGARRRPERMPTGQLVEQSLDERGVERVGARGPALDPDLVLEYALIYAAANGRRAAVERLLRHGPDLRVTEPLFGSTALGAARYHGRDELAELLAAAAAAGRAASP
jgi:ankyrin repeat protein